jgi:hypothetical protein
MHGVVGWCECMAFEMYTYKFTFDLHRKGAVTHAEMGVVYTMMQLGALPDRDMLHIQMMAMRRVLLREVISGRILPSILRTGLCPVSARCQSGSAKDGELPVRPEKWSTPYLI